MAVEIKYIVVREGREKMAFTSKKEADAYDKMLDLAEVLADWLRSSEIGIEEEQGEALALWMAENKESLSGILKSGKLPSHAVTNDGVVAEIDEPTQRKKRDAA